MARIDFLKEKADRLKIVLKFIFNAMLSLILGFSGLVYSAVVENITISIFFLLIVPLLFFFIKLVIMVISVWKTLDGIYKQIEKE